MDAKGTMEHLETLEGLRLLTGIRKLSDAMEHLAKQGSEVRGSVPAGMEPLQRSITNLCAEWRTLRQVAESCMPDAPQDSAHPRDPGA